MKKIVADYEDGMAVPLVSNIPFDSQETSDRKHRRILSWEEIRGRRNEIARIGNVGNRDARYQLAHSKAIRF